MAASIRKCITAYRLALSAIVLCAVPLIALPFADRDVGDVAKLVLPGLAFTSALSQLVTVIMLTVLYRRTHDPSRALLTAVFLAAGIVAAAFPVALPLGRDGIVPIGAQAAAWLWIAWHVVFPAGIIAYALVGLRRQAHSQSKPWNPKTIRFVLLGGAAVGVATVAWAFWAARTLPPITHGNDLSGYRTSGVGSLTLMLCLAALILLLRLRRGRARDEDVMLAVLAVTLEMVTNLFPVHRFTVLWYVGRCLFTAGSMFVLIGTIARIVAWRDHAFALRATLNKEKARSERHAERLRHLWQTNSTSADDDAFLRSMLNGASHALSEGREFYAFICHRDGGEIVVDAATRWALGPAVAVAGDRFPVHGTLIGLIAAERSTHSWGDVRADELCQRAERLLSQPWRAVIVTPFRVAQTAYYIGFASPLPLEDAGFTPLDHAYVETLASICAARLLQRAQFERLRYQTQHDLLTGIYNRATFRAQGFAAMRSGADVALAVAGLDDFRAVNDTVGHQTGDALLVEVAARLSAAAPPDDVVARLGGDTFGILMRHVRTREEAESRVRRYANVFREPFGTGDREGRERIPLTASFGIARAPDDAAGFEELLARADAAVYDAKQAGRAQSAFFDRRVEAEFQLVRRTKDELAQAFVHDQFELYFQPHIELETGRVGGAEALIRWNHPERGLVSAAEFVPFAERHGFMEQMGSWVMRETIRISAPWRQADPSLCIWCNVSPSELRRESLATRLAQVGTGLRGVGVEITEGAVMDGSSEMAKSIGMLRDAGFAIALDDFGTGYSSLSHLRRLPIDVVKIDRSFINGIPQERHDVAIVEAVTSIAERYGFSTVAEGVETMEQVAFLASIGCTYGQGYLYAAPMSAPAFERWLRDRHEPPAQIA
ncbi:MAG TPA: EAL domain-containing protein [Candidatus Elarobacter sp.]|nr:EAL domain-containing protein [Candidatus Elarobacter sp.]